MTDQLIITHYAICQVATIPDLIAICERESLVNQPQDLALVPLQDLPSPWYKVNERHTTAGHLQTSSF